MLMISFLGIYIELTVNPENAGPSEDSEYSIATDEEGLVNFYHRDDLIGVFTTIDGYYPYNPLSAPEEPFKLYGDVSGGQDSYTNLADFDAEWGTSFNDSANDINNTKTIQNIYDSGILWGVVVAILCATVALGVKVFGNGLSEFSQKTAFLGLTWGIFWASLTLTSKDLLLTGELGVFGIMIYSFLTIGFVIGIVMEVTHGGD